MAQIKKVAVRESILRSAHDMFLKRGYLKCKMEQIAKGAGTSVSNVYVYFPSKVHLFYEVYTPLLVARMLKLSRDAQNIADRHKRLRFILLTLWRDLPAENNGFAHYLIQAIVTAPPKVEMPHDLLRWCETSLNELIRNCLPKKRQHLTEDSLISFLAWMAFDGFATNIAKGELRDVEKIATHFAAMLTGEDFEPVVASKPVRRARKISRPNNSRTGVNQ